MINSNTNSATSPKKSLVVSPKSQYQPTSSPKKSNARRDSPKKKSWSGRRDGGVDKEDGGGQSLSKAASRSDPALKRTVESSERVSATLPPVNTTDRNGISYKNRLSLPMILLIR